MKKQLYIIDTTLRDGAQSPGISFSKPDKIEIAKALEKVGVYQLEAGIPAMGASEKEAILAIKDVCKKSLIAAWNRLNIKDIQHSVDCSPDIIHISVPVSDLQVYQKLQKDRLWLKKEMLTCVDYALEKGFFVTIGFEDASRADLDFMIEMGIALKQLGVKQLRFADTVGILTPHTTQLKVRSLIEHTGLDIEFHAHNDLGMAVANSIAAARAGARFIDTTINGIGERTGNCNFYQFVKAAHSFYDIMTEELAVQELVQLLKVNLHREKD